MKVQWAIAMEARFATETDDWESARAIKDEVRRQLDQHLERVRLGVGSITVTLVTTTSVIPEGEDSRGEEVPPKG